jgi:sialate O-acetylesterase
MTAAILLSAFTAGAVEKTAPAKSKSDIKLGSLFADNAVLQRQMKVPVWGWSKPGVKVRVQFAGQTKTAVAGKDGKWMLKLDPLKASAAPHKMVITNSSGKKVTLKNILVGEVWVCSGQSNMSYTMSRFGNCAREVPQMKHPQIRHFKVFSADRATPRKDVMGAWAVCSPQTAARFSATGLYYAVELYKALGVPVGLINSSAGGTTAEQWSDLATLEANRDNESVLQRRKTMIAAADAATKANPKLMPAYEKSVREYLSLVGVNPGAVDERREKAFINPDLSDAAWTATTLPRSTGNGVAWFAREVTLPREMIDRKLILNVGRVMREEIAFWNGIKLSSKRIHTIPASLTKGAKNVLSVRVAGIRGGGMSGGQSISGPGGKSLGLTGDGWKLRVYASQPNLPKKLSVRGVAGGLYNGMIHPLIPYAIRGVIWYQGENNTNRAYAYRKQFPEMIRSWRKNWGQGDFPFYFCQLANYHPKQHAIETNHGWSALREAQMMALSLPNTGMACLIDVGKLGTYERDIHPANNQDQGKRLALIARDKIYGEDIVSSGPMYDSMTVKGNQIIVKFKSVGSGLLRAGIAGWYDHRIISLPTHPPGLAIHGFTIAGADGDFRMAYARITGKDTVAVWHDKVTEPRHVRFAWHRNPLHNLYNKEKLPAPPFRTDSIDLSSRKAKKR